MLIMTTVGLRQQHLKTHIKWPGNLKFSQKLFLIHFLFCLFCLFGFYIQIHIRMLTLFLIFIVDGEFEPVVIAPLSTPPELPDVMKPQESVSNSDGS